VKAEKRVAKLGTCTTAAEQQDVGKKIAKLHVINYLMV